MPIVDLGCGVQVQELQAGAYALHASENASFPHSPC